MKRIRIFAQIEFIDHLFILNSKRNELELEGNEEFADNVSNLVKLLYGNIELYLDCTYDYFKSKSIKNPHYKKLIKARSENLTFVYFDFQWNKFFYDQNDVVLANDIPEDLNIQLKKFNIIHCRIASLKRDLASLFLQIDTNIEKGEPVEKFINKLIDNSFPISSNFIINDSFIVINENSSKLISNWINKLPKSDHDNSCIYVFCKSYNSDKKLKIEILKRCNKPEKIDLNFINKSTHNRYLISEFYFINWQHGIEIDKNGNSRNADDIAVKSKFLPKKNFKSKSGFELYQSFLRRLNSQYKFYQRNNPDFKCNNTLLTSITKR